MCFENVFMQWHNYRLKRHNDSLSMNHIYLTAIKSGLICIFIDIIIMFKLLEGHILTPQLRLTSRKKNINCCTHSSNIICDYLYS